MEKRARRAVVSRPNTLSAWLHDPLMFSRPRLAPVGEPILRRATGAGQPQAHNSRVVGARRTARWSQQRPRRRRQRGQSCRAFCGVGRRRSIGREIEIGLTKCCCSIVGRQTTELRGGPSDQVIRENPNAARGFAGAPKNRQRILSVHRGGWSWNAGPQQWY